jgi:predicted dehydrogenase
MALKVGMVGLRGIGVPHAKAHVANPLSELVAVCDTVRERAAKAAEQYGVRPYGSLREMLEHEPDLDVVDVCTGGYENGRWHYEPAMQAMQAMEASSAGLTRQRCPPGGVRPMVPR